MRKVIISITVLALILSIVGTGIIVYVESANAPEQVTPVSQDVSGTSSLTASGNVQ